MASWLTCGLWPPKRWCELTKLWFPEKDLGFLTHWGTAWFPNNVRAVLSKIYSHRIHVWYIYILTWLGYIDGIHVTIYSSTMDPMGLENPENDALVLGISMNYDWFQWPCNRIRLRTEVPIPYIRPNFQGISPQNMAKNMVLTYLHFRILEFPLMVGGFKHGFYFPFHTWDVIPTPLTNSIIFQDVFLSTNQMIISFASTVCINRWSIGMIPSSMAEWACPD